MRGASPGCVATPAVQELAWPSENLSENSSASSTTYCPYDWICEYDVSISVLKMGPDQAHSPQLRGRLSRIRVVVDIDRSAAPGLSFTDSNSSWRG